MQPHDFHDGQRVRDRCTELKLSTLEFANEMIWEHRKAQRMLNRSDWTAQDLAKAGSILGADFLSVYGGKAQEPDRVIVGIIVQKTALKSEAGRLRALEELNTEFPTT